MSSKKILKVVNVNLTIFKINPPALNIDATGLVPTGGWTNGKLVPYIYVSFPKDGIWDFDFVADEPQGPVAQVISVVSANYLWHNYPKELKGVRIHSSTNFLEAFIEAQMMIEV